MNLEIVSVMLVSCISTLFISWIVIVTSSLHGRFTLDRQHDGLHKFHLHPAPRIGGIALFLGMAIGSVYHGLQADSQLYLSKWAGVAALPVFFGGLFEDVTKKISARNRLLLALISAAIGYYELNIGLNSIGWSWFDETLLVQPGVALALTLVMVGGVAHSANIIDGFHGLLLGFTMLAVSAFVWVTLKAGGNTTLITYMGILLGATAGIFVFNFPKGKIFLGDGGAYLIGFLLAVLSLLLVNKFENISPWFPLLILAYPVYETLFSIFRKKLISRRPAMIPDKLHLHMLVYENFSESVSKILRINRNAATAVLMIGFSATPIIPALLWWNHTLVLVVTLVMFCIVYTCLYIYLSKNNIA